jgi:predicted nucleic acid-binding protein
MRTENSGETRTRTGDTTISGGSNGPGRDAETASCFARIAAAELEAGRRIRRHDAWIAATALRHGAAVATQDADFSAFEVVTVLRV